VILSDEAITRAVCSVAASRETETPPEFRAIAYAQHAANVAWLEDRCRHVGKSFNLQRRFCDTCWAEFVAAGKE
jgi:hypothetical protein